MLWETKGKKTDDDEGERKQFDGLLYRWMNFDKTRLWKLHGRREVILCCGEKQHGQNQRDFGCYL